jgi:hypothetical protein
MTSQTFDLITFENEWIDDSRKICQAVYTKPETQKLKESLQKNGFLSLEEKSKFIDVCDMTKYAYIYEKYGKEDSEGYKNFSENWKEWFQLKGVGSNKDRGQRNSVEHIMFGSTPDPVQFLNHFEHEIMGSMKPQ